MLKYLLLGLVQGLTEFLPVSSSGHLVIAQNLFGITGDELMVTVLLHLATALALVIFFIKDIIDCFHKPKLIVNIIIVTVITGAIAIAGKGFFESLFSSVKGLAVSFAITGIILIASRKFNSGHRRIEDIKLKDSVILGITQAIAIIPAISRSGITIVALLFRKMDAESAFKFSFLASIPAILGAAALELKDVQWQLVDKLNLSVGFIISFVSGLLALALLRRVMIKGKLHYFGYYCILVAIVTAIFLK